MPRTFTPVEAAAHFLASAIEIEEGMRELMEVSAEIVETEAKGMLGKYQTDLGPFADWAPLAAFTQAERAILGFPPDEPLLRNGMLRDSIEHVAAPFEAQVGSNDPVAEWQERGTPTIPPRSFLGGAAVRKADEIAMLIGGGFIAAMFTGGKFKQMVKGLAYSGERPSVMPYAATHQVLSAAGIDSVVRGFMRTLLR